VNYLVPNISCRYSPQVGIVSEMNCSHKSSDLLDHIWCKNDKHICDKIVIFWKFICGCMFAAPLQVLWWPILWQLHTQRSTAFIADPDAEVLRVWDYCLVGRHDWTSICLIVCCFFGLFDCKLFALDLFLIDSFSFCLLSTQNPLMPKLVIKRWLILSSIATSI